MEPKKLQTEDSSSEGGSSRNRAAWNGQAVINQNEENDLLTDEESGQQEDENADVDEQSFDEEDETQEDNLTGNTNDVGEPEGGEGEMEDFEESTEDADDEEGDVDRQ